MDAVPGDLAESLQQGGERVLERFRGVLLRVGQATVELEERVVDRRVALGEVEVAAGEGGDPGTGTVRVRRSGPQRGGQLGRACERDGADDLPFAAEVAVGPSPAGTTKAPASSSPPPRC
jgi:hypothetical protein